VENTHRFWIRGLAIVLALLCTAAPAWAISVEVDVDTGTPGIQSSITLPPGTTFTVDVVVVGDGMAVFDLVNFDLTFDSGILGLAGMPPGMPTVGALAGLTASGTAFDIFAGGVFRSPGDPLTTNEHSATNGNLRGSAIH